jgi:hypothetical protein
LQSNEDGRDTKGGTKHDGDSGDRIVDEP